MEAEEMTAYLFVDTFAFEKLASQPECRAGQRDATMAGYETYLIEQWACERKINTVVASYTGNSQHIIEVQVLLVPTNLSKWSAATFSHFEELMKMHILPKETKLGNMLVTSLSSLPTNLTLVSMPQRYRLGYSKFVVNENLRRLNVVGRIAVTADDPSESLIASFRRHFAVHSEPGAEYAVQELVTLMQIALFYFGLLQPSQVDGLLCDYTLKAIETWWFAVGKRRYRTVVPPRSRDKMYMRTSCAAIIGVVIGARQRMSALGLKPPKDPFDAEAFVVCIKRFQKMLKLPRTSIFDDLTYSKLVATTSKNSSLATSTTNVLTMMKSTVKEGLSGKAAEAVDDWETLDIDVLARNVRGERCKYLWQGKGVPTVNHLRASLTTQRVGEITRIPLFSLPNIGSEVDLQQTQDQHNHHHHYPHLHYHRDHNNSTSSVGNPYQSPSAGTTVQFHPSPSKKFNKSTQDLAGHPPPQGEGSTNPALPADTQDLEWDEKYNRASQAEGAPPVPSTAPKVPPASASLVNRFRRRSNKASLAEAFDDSAILETLQHSRRPSASSDHWFAQHHNDNALMNYSTATGSTTNVALPGLEQTTVLEVDEKIPTTPSPSRDQNGSTGTSSNAVDKKAGYWEMSASELLTKDDLALICTSKRNRHHKSRRGHDGVRRATSLSGIEGTVFPWDGLAPVPEVVKLHEEAQDLQSQLKKQMQSDALLKHDLGVRISSNEAALAESLRDNMVIKYHISASTKKEEAVRRRLRELEAFMARLDYELATLTVKLNDVDQSVLAFASKVDSADAKWNQMNKEQPTSWWSRWFT